MIVLLTTLLILLCLAIVLLILIQRTSGGMGSALGGGAADQYLGAGSAAQLSKLTVWGVLFFFLLAFGLYALYQSDADSSNALSRTGNLPTTDLPTLPSSLPEPELNLAEPTDADVPSAPNSSSEDAVSPDEVSPVLPEPAGNSTQ